jgi:hypothetical protein
LPVRSVLFQDVRGSIEAAAQANLQASQRGTWRQQIRTDEHTSRQNKLKEQFEDAERSLSEA